ncbi:MAG: class I SAM-dependent methyltransferase [Actinomycetota bacterium]
MTATADRWREPLEARAIPQTILDAAPESPWGFPPELFRVRAERAGSGPPTPTTLRALEALGEGGTVLDVGCGSGATSLPLAAAATHLTGIDGSPPMLAAFREAAAARWVEADAIEGAWPEAAGRAPACDVVVSGHVLYNVPDLPPFLEALTAHADRRVVVELTDHHPLFWMHDLWERFHDLRFPDGPTAEDAAAVARETGVALHREDRHVGEDRGTGGFSSRDDALALVRRRLCLPAERDAELADALGDRLRSDSEGLWSAGPAADVVVTLWWDVAG